MSSVKNKPLHVVTYTEVVGIFLGFAIVLVLLYPGRELEERVFAERSNYDLTAAYLENMLRHDTNDEALVRALISTAIRSGKPDLALKVFEVLEKSSTPALKKEVAQVRYTVEKERYLNADKSYKPQLHKELVETFEKIDLRHMTHPDDIRHWYEEARWLGKQEDAFMLALKGMRSATHDLFWPKQVYYLGKQLGKKDQAAEALEILLARDAAHKEQWLQAAFDDAITAKRYDEAKRYLEAMEKRIPQWYEAAARLALAMKDYKGASKSYIYLSRHAKTPEDQKLWFKKAVDALQYGNLMKDAVALAKEYEARYIDDRSMVKWFLKLYLAADDLEAGAKLSKKLLEMQEQKR